METCGIYCNRSQLAQMQQPDWSPHLGDVPLVVEG